MQAKGRVGVLHPEFARRLSRFSVDMRGPDGKPLQLNLPGVIEVDGQLIGADGLPLTKAQLEAARANALADADADSLTERERQRREQVCLFDWTLQSCIVFADTSCRFLCRNRKTSDSSCVWAACMRFPLPQCTRYAAATARVVHLTPEWFLVDWSMSRSLPAKWLPPSAHVASSWTASRPCSCRNSAPSDSKVTRSYPALSLLRAPTWSCGVD